MLKDMKTYAHLKPGQKGTHGLVDKYGDSLVCVRYRYDQTRGVKLKTAEIIIDEKPCACRFGYRNTDMVTLTVGYTEKAHRDALKASGGKWIRRKSCGGCRTGQSEAMLNCSRG